MAEKGKVCVTGAGGFVASWLVQLLLSKGYTVNGTLSDPLDDKNAHLKKLEKASENLKLFKVDLLDYNSLSAAITGCNGVFHVASPVPSSSGSNPENWYCLSKTEAESEALEFAKRSGLDVVTVCPLLVLGPMLQSTTNSSSLALIKLLKEGYDELENKLRMIVDARAVAESLLLAYEKPEAEGRYICVAHIIRSRDLVEMLQKSSPNYNYPKNFTQGKEEEKLSSEKLQKLGWGYRPLEETLIDSIECYGQAGLLD